MVAVDDKQLIISKEAFKMAVFPINFQQEVESVDCLRRKGVKQENLNVNVQFLQPHACVHVAYIFIAIGTFPLYFTK